MKKILISLIIIAVFIACTSKDEVYLAFDNVTYVADYPIEHKINQTSNFSSPNLGIIDFKIHDNLMILTHDAFGIQEGGKLVTIIDKDTHNLYGEFITFGRGPEECMGSIFHSNTALRNEDGNLIMFFNLNGNLCYRFDVTESMLKGSTCMSHVQGFENINLMMRALPVEDNVFLTKEVSNIFDAQVRYLLKDGEKSTTPSMDILNSICLKKKNSMSLFNVLTSYVEYDSEHDIVIEVPIFLNNINLYSLKSDFQKTVCIGEQLQDINGFRNLDSAVRWATDCRLYDDFFVVLDGSAEHETDLLFFSYDGTPIAKLNLDHICSRFDIDMPTHTLYTYDVETERFFEYDLSHFLVEIDN